MILKKTLAAGALLIASLLISEPALAAPDKSVPIVKNIHPFCLKVGYVGASLSDYKIGSAPMIKENLTKQGYIYEFNASAGRSLYSPGKGSGKEAGSGLDVLRTYKNKGVDCYIVAVATNDSAELNGDYEGAIQRIEEAMTIIGPNSRVEWIAPVTKITDPSKKYSDENMQVFRKALIAQSNKHNNLNVNHWNHIAKNKTGTFWRKDKIHLNTGKQQFADYATNTLNLTF